MNAKEIRKQIRNVLQEEGANEAIKVAVEQCEALIVSKLAEIENMCLARIEGMHKDINAQLATMDKRAKAIQGFIVSEVKGKFQQQVADNEDKVDAALQVIAESLNLDPEATFTKVAQLASKIREDKAAAQAAALSARLEDQRKASESSDDQAQASQPQA